MAETISFRVTIDPRPSQQTTAKRDGGSVHELVLSTTNAAAIRTLLDEIKAGTDVSSVVTAINAL